MGNARKYFPLLAAGLLASGAAQATLFDRGGGLLYDDVLKVTWLRDANHARTSGYDADGLMNWSAANTWAANLVYHDSVRGVDWSDWRLARNSPVGPTGWNYYWSYDGSTDYSYNITSPQPELAYMYYVNLGLKGFYSPTGAGQPDWGIFRNGTFGDQADVDPVKNLKSSYGYWSGSAYARNPAVYAWHFDTDYGYQYVSYDPSYAWAVGDGDVAAVPEPETVALFLAGLAVMGRAVRRRRGFGPT